MADLQEFCGYLDLLRNFIYAYIGRIDPLEDRFELQGRFFECFGSFALHTRKCRIILEPG